MVAKSVHARFPAPARPQVSVWHLMFYALWNNQMWPLLFSLDLPNDFWCRTEQRGSINPGSDSAACVMFGLTKVHFIPGRFSLWFVSILISKTLQLHRGLKPQTGGGQGGIPGKHFITISIRMFFNIIGQVICINLGLYYIFHHSYSKIWHFWD